MSRNVTYAPTGNRGTVISARTRSDLDSRLREHGPSPVHRRSFAPVRVLLEVNP